jgi:vacuolar protein sorting-associated protein 29
VVPWGDLEALAAV